MSLPKLWIRVDNRLIHGQIVENWLPYLDVGIIVIANDQLAQEELQQEIIRLAIPKNISLFFCFVQRSLETLHAAGADGSGKTLLIIFDSCADAQKALQVGVPFSRLNIGNIHYESGKRQICDHVALSQDDIQCLRFFEDQGVQLDFRCLPNKQVHVKTIW